MTPRLAERSTNPTRLLLLVACVVASITVESAPLACSAALLQSGNDARIAGIALLAIAVASSSVNGVRHRLASRLGYLLLSGDWVADHAAPGDRSGKLLLEDFLGRAGPALRDAAVVAGYLAVIAFQRPLFAIIVATATCLAHRVTTRIARSESAAPTVDLWKLPVGPEDTDCRLRWDRERAEWEASWNERAHWLRQLLRGRMWSDVASETLAYGVAAAGVLPLLETPSPSSIAQGILALKLADGLLHFVGTGVPPKQYVAWVRGALLGVERTARRENNG